jgi:translation initiation factor eIF-2B subunit epsilon
MGPKTAKVAVAKGKSQEDEKEDVLQAVVVADTFETKFTPFTLERPRCLLPLANTPLIEYTLDFLAQSGVQEVFFSAGSHTEQVEKYIDQSKWRQKTSPFKKFTFLKSAATSVGDVMRDLDQKGLLSGDFLSVSGDVVSNLPITVALAKHKARRQKDKNAIMTMLLREVGLSQRAKERVCVPTFVIDPANNRCLHYEEGRRGQRAHLTIDPETLSHSELDIRQDLIDCRIDICTPEMLSLWSDNFDNQSPRKDFLHGVLKDHELNGKTIHTYIVKDHFASRASDLRAYDTLSNDIASRWTFPACPDTRDRYRLSPAGVYQEEGVMLARSCQVKPRSIIGRGTSIGDKTLIVNSVVGRNCLIGRNVQIRNSHIWDSAVIGDDAKILHAIIGDEAVVGRGCTVDDGSLISFGVEIGQGQNVAQGSRITRTRISDDGANGHNADIVGEGGKGYAYEDDVEGQEDVKSAGLGERTSRLRPNPCSHYVVYQNADFVASNSSLSSNGSEESEARSAFAGSRSESFATTMSDDDVTDRFHHEAVVSLFERMQRGTHQDDVRVELMGLRFAQNATEHQVRRAIAVSLMKHISHQVESDKAKPADAVKQSLISYRKLIQREQSQETAADHVDFLLEAQKDLIHRSHGDQILLHMTKELYDQDLFEEEVFTEWWEDERSGSTEDLKHVREPTRQFLDWLANADEESESDDDDDDE